MPPIFAVFKEEFLFFSTANSKQILKVTRGLGTLKWIIEKLFGYILAGNNRNVNGSSVYIHECYNFLV